MPAQASVMCYRLKLLVQNSRYIQKITHVNKLYMNIIRYTQDNMKVVDLKRSPKPFHYDIILDIAVLLLCLKGQHVLLLTSIAPFVGDERASEIVSLARAKLRRGTSNNLCTAPYTN